MHNYHSTYNVLPADDMWMGATYGNSAATRGSWGWNASWPVCLLPNIEQTPLYNAYNHGFLTRFSAELDRQLQRHGNVALPVGKPEGAAQQSLGPDELPGNHGGPGIIRIWNGTVETTFTCATTNQIPINGWPVGTCWWGADSNLAYFGLEGVTDGSSNTALFSEKLLGASTADPAPDRQLA